MMGVLEYVSLGLLGSSNFWSCFETTTKRIMTIIEDNNKTPNKSCIDQHVSFQQYNYEMKTNMTDKMFLYPE